MTVRPGLIVVGVDGTAVSEAALTLAMQEAGLRSSRLVVVTAWQYDIEFDTLSWQQPSDVEERAHRVQEAAIAAALGRLALAPAISRRVVEGEAGLELVFAARGADLLVIGSKHKNALERVVLRSVSQFCLRHATCPVVVVPPTLVAHELVGVRNPPHGRTNHH